MSTLVDFTAVVDLGALGRHALECAAWVSGSYIPATQTAPAEYPEAELCDAELELDGVRVNLASELYASERERLEGLAIEAAKKQVCDAEAERELEMAEAA